MLNPKILANIGRNIGVVSKMIQVVFDRHLSKETNLFGAHVACMMVMNAANSMSLEQISKDFGVPEADRAAFLAPLFDQEFIAHAAADDLTSVKITPYGQELLAKLWAAAEKANDGIFAGFTEDEVTLLNQQLERMQINCEKLLS
jgi:DNA-binding MarR family transcriptional regulator